MSSEERLNEIADKLATLIGQHETETQIRAEWRKSIEDRLKPVEDFVHRLDTPIRVIGWAFALVSASMLTAIGAGIWKWFHDHF